MTGAEVPSSFRKLQHTFGIRVLIRGFLFSAKYLPVWFLRAFSSYIAIPLAVLFTRKNFGFVMDNMRRIRPGISRLRAARLAFEVYRNYAYYLIDLFHISHGLDRIKDYDIKVSGGEHIKKARRAGRGVVLLTTHFGNWELGGLVLSGQDEKIHVLYSPDSSDLLEKQRNRIRDDVNIEEIPLREGEVNSLKLYRVLEQGGIVALQGDRLQFDRGVSVSFFGADARFPQGPVRLAALSGSPVVPVFIPMKGHKKYEIIIEKPLEMEHDNRLQYNLSKLTGIFEKYISLYPSQWYAFAPFWDEENKGAS